MLQGLHLVKTFGHPQKTVALDGVSVEVAAGEFVAVMGPSGSGKSTLLFVLSGTDRADEGEVRLEGTRLNDLNDDDLSDLRRNRMGFVFQQPALLRNLNLLDNILLPRLRDDKANRKTWTTKALALMERTGIAGLEERHITEVSGGQLQRAGLCRALLGNPGILFADEPTGALNSQASAEIMKLLGEFHREGTAVFLVTHDARVAAGAQRVLFMKDGQISSEIRFAQENPEERLALVAETMHALGV